MPTDLYRSPGTPPDPVAAMQARRRRGTSADAGAMGTPQGLSQAAGQLASAIVSHGRLRGLTIDQLATARGLSFADARAGFASALDLVARTSRGERVSTASLRAAPDLESRLVAGDTFDTASARLVSYAAAPRASARAYSPRGDAGYAGDAGSPLSAFMGGSSGGGGSSVMLAPLSAAALASAASTAARAGAPLGVSTWNAPAPQTAAALAMPAAGGAVIPNGAAYMEAQKLVRDWMAHNPPVTPAGYGATSGDFDGKTGPRSRAAFAYFQVATGYTRRDGVADAGTVAWLRAALAADVGLYFEGETVREAQSNVSAWMARNPPSTPPDFGPGQKDFDGKWGARTRTALARFQSVRGGLRTDGKLDDATANALRSALTNGPVTASPVPSGPAGSTSTTVFQGPTLGGLQETVAQVLAGNPHATLPPTTVTTTTTTPQRDAPLGPMLGGNGVKTDPLTLPPQASASSSLVPVVVAGGVVTAAYLAWKATKKKRST